MKTNIFNSILEKSKDEKSYLNIYRDKDNTDKFSTGFICSYDDDFVLLKKVSPEGNFDGFSIILTEDIYCIEFEDDYIKKIQFLIKDEIVETMFEVQKLLQSSFRFDDVIKLYINQQYLISIDSIYDREFLGYIKEFDGENVIIKNIDGNNKSDGYSFFRISEIERTTLFSQELIAIENLKPAPQSR